MAHGVPDFGVTNAPKTLYQVLEMGELAVRLRSIVSHDRRGDVLGLDDFENGLSKWLPGTSGSSALVQLSLERARSGLFSCRLVAGSTASCYAQIQRSFPIPVYSPVGAEISFNLDSAIDNFMLQVNVVTGTAVLLAAARWRDTTHDLQVQTGAAIWTTVATGLDLAEVESHFHVLKVVMDPTTKKYVRVILNDALYDVSALPVVSTPGALPRRLITVVQLTGRAGFNDVAYVDDAIYTFNEG